MRFSIIIPVYNVEKYIDKCMNTVMHQTFDDYEVIVVNDETPDNSMEIVQKYADAFPGKIQVIHQKNTRQGGARNNGVTHARGEYILFVDSDDYVALDMLEVVNRRLQENPCDVLVFQYVCVTEGGKKLEMGGHGEFTAGVYHPAEDRSVVLLPTGPVNKAFRRSFYVDTQVRFPEKLLYEDAVTRLFYALAESIVVCDDVLYYYVQSTDSSMRQNISEKMLDILTVTDITRREFEQRGIYQDFRDPLDCALIYGITYILDLINTVEPDHPLQSPMADYIGRVFPDYRNNPCVGRTLCKALDCLTAHKFKTYHYRYLWGSRIIEKLLCIPPVAALNRFRRRLF